MFVCALHHAWCPGSPKDIGPLDPAVQIVVSCCVVLEGQSWVLWKSSRGAKSCGAVTLVLNLLAFYLS